MIFKDIPIGGLFITGPGQHIQIKLDNEEGLPNVPGGNARMLYDGTAVWIPENRCVTLPEKRDFIKVWDDYHWKQIATVTP